MCSLGKENCYFKNFSRNVMPSHMHCSKYFTPKKKIKYKSIFVCKALKFRQTQLFNEHLINIAIRPLHGTYIVYSTWVNLLVCRTQFRYTPYEVLNSSRNAAFNHKMIIGGELRMESGCRDLLMLNSIGGDPVYSIQKSTLDHCFRWHAA